MAISTTCSISREAGFRRFGAGVILKLVNVISLVADGRIIGDRLGVTLDATEITAGRGFVHMILMVVSVQETTDSGCVTVAGSTASTRCTLSASPSDRRVVTIRVIAITVTIGIVTIASAAWSVLEPLGVG